MGKSIEELKQEVFKTQEFINYKKSLEALSSTPQHIAYKEALSKKEQ
jgi:hypothetical protein